VHRIALLLALALSACATTYQPRGATGGFSETQMGDGIYQVRFQGNGYTSLDLTTEFLMRRCAELTLEKGARYFTLISDTGTGATVSGSAWMTASFPSGNVMMKILREGGENALDAVTVMEQTAERAAGAMSPAARATLTKIKAPAR
jgi:hypothetical protein